MSHATGTFLTVGRPDSSDEAGAGAPAWYPPCKAVADAVVAASLLALTAPLLALLMIAVKATSRGPAVYSQLRVGRGGRAFRIFKLRTMVDDCEKATGPRWSVRNDPRVTGLGRFLRRSHLDELPQLWNVLRGEMSLVGPRPERPEFVAKLEREVPAYRGRLDVRPGITGLAQVQLPPDEAVEDVCRKVRCDLCYIRRLDPWLDLRILLGTVMKVAGVPFQVTRRVLALPGGEAAAVEAVAGPAPGAESAPITRLRSI